MKRIGERSKIDQRCKPQNAAMSDRTRVLVAMLAVSVLTALFTALVVLIGLGMLVTIVTH